MSRRLLLLVGTKKGGFILDGDEARQDWQLRGPLCEGWPIYDMNWDGRAETIYAAGGSSWYGAAIWRSDDLGTTWTHSSEGLTYGDEGPSLRTAWNVTPADGAVYAGVEPAGLFRSEDGGQTWRHVEGLRRHPSCPEWQPGNGGLCLHSIVPHPGDRDRMWVGISAVGTFYTEDGGESWETRNRGVRAEFAPERYPEFGQCVHKLVMAPDTPERLYQQNHCGVYRSEDGGATWREITAGLPSDFGFPMVVHPRDRESAFVIPLNGAEEGRYMPDASAAVWRTEDAGASWVRLDRGLPQEHAYVGVLREAMAIDSLEPAGVYFGTSTGEVYGSADEGASWRLVAAHLPPVWSVEAAVVGR
ncbi:MAG: exo-alpha-sialidase [Chloroflexota bacterium]|nr:exo-alpha-sialidase [Chloroflexota bacterium]